MDKEYLVNPTHIQLEYIKDCVNNEIETAKATISCSDNRMSRNKAKTSLKFFEEFKKTLDEHE